MPRCIAIRTHLEAYLAGLGVLHGVEHVVRVLTRICKIKPLYINLIGLYDAMDRPLYAELTTKRPAAEQAFVILTAIGILVLAPQL